jgi:hypothetical protein
VAALHLEIGVDVNARTHNQRQNAPVCTAAAGNAWTESHLIDIGAGAHVRGRDRNAALKISEANLHAMMIGFWPGTAPSWHSAWPRRPTQRYLLLRLEVSVSDEEKSNY